MTHMQVFVSASLAEPSPYVELTFFPQDIRSAADLANAFLAWGPTSKAQLVSWGVPQERIVCVGHPRREQFARRMHEAIQIQGSSDVVEILLLATVPPRDERPDAVTLRPKA